DPLAISAKRKGLVSVCFDITAGPVGASACRSPAILCLAAGFGGASAALGGSAPGRPPLELTPAAGPSDPAGLVPHPALEVHSHKPNMKRDRADRGRREVQSLMKHVLSTAGVSA